ncbi:AAA family ATPase [Bifidobacterium ruminantium]|uniref:AAA family ATPase n=1 Tax=Bifidobacterium ruminantium TaxID=78346 RepID=UPI001ED98D76|nr:AAA family ATPase [Bifidobacterium ruminantium]
MNVLEGAKGTVYLRRKIDRFLLDWKADSNRKPLIVKGSRQVGKTAAIRHFASANYRSVVEINFVENPKYRAITQNGYSVDEVVKSMSLLDPTLCFIPHETLIFFDEIQDHPDIATTLKFFRQDGRFDVICSGSMLGISYRTIESNSVGYKTD